VPVFFPFGIPSTSSYAETSSIAKLTGVASYVVSYALTASYGPTFPSEYSAYDDVVGIAPTGTVAA